jgi:hypothetical protein
MELAFERVSHRAVKAAFLCAALVWGHEVRLLQACNGTYGAKRSARPAGVRNNSAAKPLFPAYNFWGIIAVTEVTDIEAPFLVQSYGSHVKPPYWPR